MAFAADEVFAYLLASLGGPFACLRPPKPSALAFVPHVVKVYLVVSSTGGYNLKAPRSIAGESSTPTGQMISRCIAAHANGFEALLLFAVGVFAAKIAKVPSARVDTLSAIFIISRCLYNYFYIAGTNQVKASMRSLSWAVGFGASVALMLSAAYSEYQS